MLALVLASALLGQSFNGVYADVSEGSFCNLGGCTLTGPLKLTISGSTVILDTASNLLRVRNLANTDYAPIAGASLTLSGGGSETLVFDASADAGLASVSDVCWAVDAVASHSKDTCLYRVSAGRLGTSVTAGGTTTLIQYAEGMVSSTAAVDWNVSTKTTLFTVPTGKSLVVTKVFYRNASANATTASCGVGFNAAPSNDVITAATHPSLTGSTLYTFDSPKAGALVGTAGAVLGISCPTPQGGALTVTVEVFGYLF
jgi:hypothetical protein